MDLTVYTASKEEEPPGPLALAGPQEEERSPAGGLARLFPQHAETLLPSTQSPSQAPEAGEGLGGPTSSCTTVKYTVPQ